MDKHTLSHYGLILVSTIIIVIILGLLSPLTPFGDDVRASINEAVNKYIDKTPVEEVDNNRDDINPSPDGRNITKEVVINLIYESGGNIRDALRYTVNYGDKFSVQDKLTAEGISVTGYEPSNIPKTQSITKDTNFTIIYVPNSYTITFVTNGGEIKSNIPSSYKFKQTTQLPTKVEKKGYYFVGWYEKSDFSDDIHTEILNYEKGNKIYYAKWAEKAYKITYMSNGKEVTSIENKYKTMKWGASFTLPRLSTEGGMTFVGWYDNPYAQGTEISASPKEPDGDITLYAGWSKNGYRIDYVLNGGHIIGSSYATGYAPGSKVILPTTVEKRGYDFVGWCSDATLKNIVTEIGIKEYGHKKFYAKWKNSVYNITYDFDAGTTTDAYPTQYIFSETQDSDAYPVHVTRVGYTFIGWKDVTLGTVGELCAKANRVGNITLVAQYVRNTYKITYYGNGINPDAKPAEQYSYVQYGSRYGTAPSVARNGYDLIGWFTGKTGGTQIEEAKPYKIDGNSSLYAHWKEATYKITYALDGGTFRSSYPTEYTYGKETTLSTNISKTYYTFGGWYTSSSFIASSKNTDNKISSTTYGDITLYAKWIPNVYNISYDLDGGTLTGTYPTTYTYGILTELPTPKKAGYDFCGWMDITDGDKSDDGKFLTQIEVGTNGNKKYKAKWKEKTCIIKFALVDENGNAIKNSEGKDYIYEFGPIEYGKKYEFIENQYTSIYGLDDYYHLPFSFTYTHNTASKKESNKLLPFDKTIDIVCYKYNVIQGITYYNGKRYDKVGKENLYEKIYYKQTRHDSNPTLKLLYMTKDGCYTFDKTNLSNGSGFDTTQIDFKAQDENGKYYYKNSIDVSLKNLISSGTTILPIYYKSTQMNVSYDMGEGTTTANKTLVNFGGSTTVNATLNNLSIQNIPLGNSKYRVVLNGSTTRDAAMLDLFNYSGVSNGDFYEIEFKYVSGSMPSTIAACYALDVQDINTGEQMRNNRIYQDIQFPCSYWRPKSVVSETFKVYGLQQGQSNPRIKVAIYVDKIATFNNYTFEYTVKKVDNYNSSTVSRESYPEIISYNDGNCAFTIKNPTRGCHTFKGFSLIDVDGNDCGQRIEDTTVITDNGDGTTTITPLSPDDIRLRANWEEPDVTNSAHCLTNRTLTKAGSCVVAEEYTYTCVWCNKTKTDVGSVTGHQSIYGGTQYVHTKCSVCGVTLSSNHSMYVSADVGSNCTTGGYTTYKCACGYSYTNHKSALGHDYSRSWAVSPTCTAQGYTVHQCTRCNGTYNDNWQGALGHLSSGTAFCGTWHQRKGNYCGTKHGNKKTGTYYATRVLCGRNGTCNAGLGTQTWCALCYPKSGNNVAGKTRLNCAGHS